MPRRIRIGYPKTYRIAGEAGSYVQTGQGALFGSGSVAPTTATLVGITSGLTGSTGTYTVTFNRPAEQTYTIYWLKDGATVEVDTIGIGATSCTYTPTWGAAGTVSIDFTVSPNLSRAGQPIIVTVTTPAVVSPGTITQLGAVTLVAHCNTVRSNMGPITGETKDQVDVRMGGVVQQILDYSGMVISDDGRYVSFPVSAGHSACSDDGFYRYDLQTSTFVYPPPVWPSQYGTGLGSTANAYGEYTNAPVGYGRPADQHSYSHHLTVGDNVIQAMGYGITVSGASSSKQAHIWRASTGVWERYGSLSGGVPGNIALCHYDAVRQRIVRFPAPANNGAIDTIPSNLSQGDNVTAWTTQTITSSGGTYEKWLPLDISKCLGYHQGMDCYFVVCPGQLSPRTRVYVMSAADLTAGWTEAVGSTGVIPPANIGEQHPEYVPPMGAFAFASFSEPNKLYYLKPPLSGVSTDPWVWSSETFTGVNTPWRQAYPPESRLRWSALKRGLIAWKDPSYLPELFVPYEVAAYYDWQDRTARATAAGIAYGKGAAFYDFSEQPANGGDWKYGSISANPKITVEVPLISRSYDNPNISGNQPYHSRDLTVYPPGSRGSLRMTVPDGGHNSTDNWRISVDEYSRQYGAGDEFWCCWRVRMNETYAKWRFKAAEGGITGPGTVWNGSYTEPKLFMSGYGMQYPSGPGIYAGRTALYYGYAPGSAQSNDLLQYHSADCKGEIVMITNTDQMVPGGPPGWMKYIGVYISKFFDQLYSRGQNINYYTQQNEGSESGYAVRACQFYDAGGGAGNQYTDYTTCWTCPTDEWFSIMIHVKFGNETTGVTNIIGSPTRTGYMSEVEYYGAHLGQPWKLLHRRTGIIIPTDTPGAEGPAKFGIFNWTTYMTNKLSTEVHPDGIYWVSQIILQPGPVMPTAPI